MMNATDIAFPNLSIYLTNVPKSISIGGFDIAFYGMIIACGIMLGFTLAAWLFNDRGLPRDMVWDFSIPAVIFSIIGARIYYVATSWEKYRDNPISVFYLRQGGIGIYGAIIAAFITLFVFAKIKKIPSLVFADTLIAGLPLGQLMGRWGNFFNREAFGGYSNGLFAMRLPIEAVRANDISPELADTIIEGTNYIQVHPTFLYESLWNLGLLIVLILYRKHKHFEGELFLLYIFGYGVGRFFIESLRTDQLIIPGTTIPISMAVGSVSAVIALILIIVGHIKLPKTSYYILKENEEKK